MKDAVITTGKLGFRYLRIDSLCIMQDDAADKAKEISKMGTVYKNLLSLLLCRVQDWHLMGFSILEATLSSAVSHSATQKDRLGACGWVNGIPPAATHLESPSMDIARELTIPSNPHLWGTRASLAMPG
jgi:hypothetical protein